MIMQKLRKKKFARFLEEADLFINLNHLKHQVKHCGFNILDCHLHPREHNLSKTVKNDFILLLEKVN